MRIVWVLMANVREDVQHFAAGTKVRCFPDLEDELVKVIGRQRGGQLVEMGVPPQQLGNWRAKREGNPTIVQRLRCCWTEQRARERADLMNARP